MSRRWRLFWGEQGIRQGEISDWSSAELHLRAGDVSTFEVRVSADQIPASVVWGQKLTVEFVCYDRDSLVGDTVMIGYAEEPELAISEAGSFLDVTGFDPMVWLADRIILPDPFSERRPIGNFGGYLRTTGPPGRLVRYYAAENAVGAPNGFAMAYRAVPNMSVEAEAESYDDGSVQTYYGRYQSVLEAAQEIVKGTDTGYRFDGLRFETFQVQQRPGVVFSFAQGNVTALRYSMQRPRATALYGAGQGEGVNRTIVYRAVLVGTNTPRGPGVYRRTDLIRERFVDKRGTPEASDIDADLGKQLAEDGYARYAVQFELIDAPGSQFLIDWNLWDVVTVDLTGEVGSRFTAPVTEAQITIDADGVRVRPTLGNAELLAGLRVFGKVGAHGQRISALERV